MMADFMTNEEIDSMVEAVNNAAAIVRISSASFVTVVKAGDTWCNLGGRNKKTKKGGVFVVEDVCDGCVRFHNGGTAQEEAILGDKEWVLLGRVYTPGEESELVEA
jgi:hypothetical protein